MLIGWTINHFHGSSRSTRKTLPSFTKNAGMHAPASAPRCWQKGPAQPEGSRQEKAPIARKDMRPSWREILQKDTSSLRRISKHCKDKRCHTMHRPRAKRLSFPAHKTRNKKNKNKNKRNEKTRSQDFYDSTPLHSTPLHSRWSKKPRCRFLFPHCISARHWWKLRTTPCSAPSRQQDNDSTPSGGATDPRQDSGYYTRSGICPPIKTKWHDGRLTAPTEFKNSHAPSMRSILISEVFSQASMPLTKSSTTDDCSYTK